MSPYRLLYLYLQLLYIQFWEDSIAETPVTEKTGQTTPWIRERDAVAERMLAGGGRPGVADPALRSGKTGLELLQAMLRGELPFPPIAETLDFSLISIEAGKAVFQSTPQFKHYNPLGSVHGGWYATLLDSALGCAVQSMYAHGTTTCLVFEVPTR